MLKGKIQIIFKSRKWFRFNNSHDIYRNLFSITNRFFVCYVCIIYKYTLNILTIKFANNKQIFLRESHTYRNNCLHLTEKIKIEDITLLWYSILPCVQSNSIIFIKQIIVGDISGSLSTLWLAKVTTCSHTAWPWCLALYLLPRSY